MSQVTNKIEIRGMGAVRPGDTVLVNFAAGVSFDDAMDMLRGLSDANPGIEFQGLGEQIESVLVVRNDQPDG